MTRAERARHAGTWSVLGPLILIGLVAALLARPPHPIQEAAPTAPGAISALESRS